MTMAFATAAGSRWRGWAGLFSFFFMLCTLFALFVTLGEGWGDYRRSQWPQTSARIKHCELQKRRGSRAGYVIILCRIDLGDPGLAKVYSRSAPANRGGPWQDWVEAHPDGSSIAARYDPQNPRNAVLVTDAAPIWGPHTPTNLKLLAACALLSAATFVVARIGRR